MGRGDVTKEELLEFYEKHLKEFNEIISKYDELTPPSLVLKTSRFVNYHQKLVIQ